MARMRNSSAGSNKAQGSSESLLNSPLVLGVILAYCITLVVFVLASLMFTFTPLPEAVMPYLTYITSIISVLIGSIYAAGKIGYKGWLNGGICGLLYFLGLFILSLVLGVQIVYGLQLISRALLAFVIGAVGGILGINIS
ncbi:TIGR04086 family membrane protein [Natranaerobius thermophilus]|uniref:TIGR04086 family membrane protein n=1 Tax=Natranaerobius thermophilus (strain ATCC BAA-1301 / DSM 18059 / JW/NM-WN-LF) TaxID=457570 RepID=B2A5K6_NATTJ|nr:TIGR04086 family membrane protein [Natranaerobius thermophilus]ACB85361.1 conserved hypothetical protein [Natranaerobius thermophilus JW/NM-WN-LF]